MNGDTDDDVLTTSFVPGTFREVGDSFADPVCPDTSPLPQPSMPCSSQSMVCSTRCSRLAKCRYFDYIVWNPSLVRLTLTQSYTYFIIWYITRCEVFPGHCETCRKCHLWSCLGWVKRQRQWIGNMIWNYLNQFWPLIVCCPQMGDTANDFCAPMIDEGIWGACKPFIDWRYWRDLCKTDYCACEPSMSYKILCMYGAAMAYECLQLGIEINWYHYPNYAACKSELMHHLLLYFCVYSTLFRNDRTKEISQKHIGPFWKMPSVCLTIFVIVVGWKIPQEKQIKLSVLTALLANKIDEAVISVNFCRASPLWQQMVYF